MRLDTHMFGMARRYTRFSMHNRRIQVSISLLLPFSSSHFYFRIGCLYRPRELYQHVSRDLHAIRARNLSRFRKME